jgi:hypothetical protein
MSAKIIDARDRFTRDLRPSEMYPQTVKALEALSQEVEREESLFRLLSDSVRWERFKRKHGLIERLPIHIDYVNKGPLP